MPKAVCRTVWKMQHDECSPLRTVRNEAWLCNANLYFVLHRCANFVRFYDGSYRLTDFDNSRIAYKEDMGMTTLEICPPEM